MHMMAAGLAEAVTKAGVEIRYSSPVTRILRTPGRRASPASRSTRPSGSTPTPSCATSTCPSRTASCCPASTRPASPARASTRRRACSGWPACAGLPPADASHHNIHFGEDWDGSFKALIDDGVRMPDPSILVTLHSLDDRSLAPEGALEHLRARADAEPRAARSTGAASGTASSTTCAGASAPLGYPTEVVVEEIYDPHDWERMGMERGTPFALAHTLLPDRPVPPEQRRPAGARPRVRRLGDPARASASRWCSCRASSPPNGSSE